MHVADPRTRDGLRDSRAVGVSWHATLVRMNITKGFALAVALGFAFGLGCATAVTVIPPARAQTGVERWEYLEIRHGWDDGQWANEAGAEGWEFVGFRPGYPNMLFKRRL